MCEKPLIGPADLGLIYDSEGHNTEIKTIAAAREEAERKAIVIALEQCGKNLSEAARRLDVSRVTLYRLIEKHEILYQ
jgi:transcriptional regulator of acetoin/glycerol metabolism